MILRASILLTVGILVGQPSSLAQVVPATSSAENTRPILLLVHGCCQRPGAASAQREWIQSLNGGLKRIGYSDLIRSSDVRFFWYADLFGKPPAIDCVSHESIPHSSYLISDQAAAAARKAAIHFMARVLSSSESLETKAMKNFLPDVTEYLTNDKKRCEIQDHVIELFRELGAQQRPVIAAAHSLGSLIIFDVLYDYKPYEADRNFKVEELITFGSMLAYPSVFRALLGKYIEPPFMVPSRIMSWTNVINTSDLLAFPLEGTLEARPGMAPPKDLEFNLEARNSHEMSTYFQNDRFMHAVADAWCRAAREASGLKEVHGCKAGRN